MNDKNDLISQIEQFLAEGGEMPDGEELLHKLHELADNPDSAIAWFDTLTPEEQRVLLETVNARVDKIRDLLSPMIAAIMEFVKAIVQAMTPLFEKLIATAEEIDYLVRQWAKPYVEECRRVALAHQLRCWGIPIFIALWIARIWPIRWLPVQAMPPPFNTRCCIDKARTRVLFFA